MNEERLTHQEIDEIGAIVGLVLLQEGEQSNDLTDMVDRVCRELQEINEEIDKCRREIALLRAMLEGK